MRVSDFHGMRLHAIAGIGHPQRFFDHLKNLGLAVQATLFLTITATLRRI